MGGLFGVDESDDWGGREPVPIQRRTHRDDQIRSGTSIRVGRLPLRNLTMKNFITSTKLQALSKGVLGLTAVGMFMGGSWANLGSYFF